MVGRLVGKGDPAHQVWLPPLSEPPTLDELLPPLQVDAERGLHPGGWPGLGRLQVPVGLVDKPYHQRREPLLLDLSGAGGHVAVVGAPQSGKSTLLRDLITGMALTHTPEEVQFYCLDFGGGSLGSLIGLPGNPVSSFLTFLLFVRPMLLKLQGAAATEPRSYPMRADFDWPRPDKRREFLRARRNAQGGLDLFPNQSSGVMTSAVWGDGVVDNPSGQVIRTGDTVAFVPFAEWLS